MQHQINTEQIGVPQAEEMAHAVSTCVHCGFCLPACPTYNVLGEEMDSPRGRIILMRDVLEGKMALNTAAPYIDRCLGCLGCVTACPSGVPYGELITSFRAYSEDKRERPLMDKVARKLVSETLPHPGRFRAASAMGKLAQPLAGLMPKQMGAMLNLVPSHLPTAQPLPEVYPAQGQRRARVALLSGCVQQVLAPQINWATLKVLAANGVEVIIPKGQGCCGSLGMHTGDGDGARTLAQVNLDVFDLSDVDAVITNAAGCGSGMKEYGLLFKGTPYAEKANAFAAKVRDISEFLDALGMLDPKPLPQPMKVAYHDACHLAHAQGVVGAPRRLLQRIPNLTLVEIPEGELCCGSAGSYNIEQPEIAAQLGERKARNIAKVAPEAVVTGNIGCMVQIGKHSGLPVYHTLEILAMGN